MSVWKTVTQSWKPPFFKGAGLSVAIAFLAAVFVFTTEDFVTRALGGETLPWGACLAFLIWLAFGAALFFAITLALSQVGRQRRARTTTVCEIDGTPNPDIGGRRFLIAGFSQFNRGVEDRTIKHVLPGEKDSSGKVSFAFEDLSLEDALGAKGVAILGNWQQTLRVVYRLSKNRSLSHVAFFIGDQGWNPTSEAAKAELAELEKMSTDPSVRQAERLVEILNHYFGPASKNGCRVDISITCDPVAGAYFGMTRGASDRSYNNANHVQDALEASARHLMRRACVTDRAAFEENAFIDVTSGTSVLSIAAAAFSFNRGYHFVYIGSGKSDSKKLFVTKTELDLGMLHEG